MSVCTSSIRLYSHAQVSRAMFFFFQAEDGIRDYKVTGVQTCALPISNVEMLCVCRGLAFLGREVKVPPTAWYSYSFRPLLTPLERIRKNRIVWSRRRSEERRVGKEGRSRWSPYH